MLIKDEHFRNYYRKAIIIKDKDAACKIAQMFEIDRIWEDDLTGKEIKEKMEAIEIADDINALLVMPYIDHTAGLSFLVLTTAKINGSEIEIIKREDFSVRSVLRKDKVNDLQFEYLENLKTNDEFDIEYYDEYISQLKTYFVNNGVEALRFIDILDNARNEDFPDDLNAFFIKDGLQMEGMWVRCEDITDENNIKATLLNTPYQEFGVEAGDEVVVFPYKIEENGEWIVICDLNEKDD